MSKRRSDGHGMVVQNLIRSANIEVIPLRGVDDKLGVIPGNTSVTVTCSPKFGLERTLALTERLVARGYRVVPHLAARQVTDERELRQIIARLDALNVRDLYVIGGDAPEPVGSYDNAAALLRDLAEIEHNIVNIGVACYPDGHPAISEDVLFDALLEKQPYATYMVSQLCFDVETLLAWLHDVRARGVSLPLHMGLAAPMNSRKLLDLSMRIGVGSSIRFLSKQHGFLRNLLFGAAYRPQRLLQSIGDQLADEVLNIDRLHLFSFNQVEATVDWQRQAAGRHETTPDDTALNRRTPGPAVSDQNAPDETSRV